MNRLGFCFGYGASGEDGIGASGATSINDLDLTVRRTVEPAADGDLVVELRSADEDSRAEVTVHLDEHEARALASALSRATSSTTCAFPAPVDPKTD